MAVSAEYLMHVRGIEDVTVSFDLDPQTITPSHDIGGDVILALGSGTTPPVTKVWGKQLQLSGGTLTFDLKALASPLDANVDFDTLKVNLYKFKAADANTAVIIIKPAVSNGYHIFGDADGQHTIGAGDEIAGLLKESSPDVGAGAKDITVTSTDQDAIFDVVLCAG